MNASNKLHKTWNAKCRGAQSQHIVLIVSYFALICIKWSLQGVGCNTTHILQLTTIKYYKSPVKTIRPSIIASNAAAHQKRHSRNSYSIIQSNSKC